MLKITSRTYSKEARRVILGFKDQFEKPIVEGTKRHTIRDQRKIPIQSGDILQMYVNTRQSSQRIIHVSLCTGVQPITIGKRGVTLHNGHGVVIKPDPDEFAHDDGFSSYGELLEFFGQKLPQRRILIHWQSPGDQFAMLLEEMASEMFAMDPETPEKKGNYLPANVYEGTRRYIGANPFIHPFLLERTGQFIGQMWSAIEHARRAENKLAKKAKAAKAGSR